MGPRRIRGRKFYWRTSDPLAGTHPRGRKDQHSSEELCIEVTLIEPGARLRIRVWFDGISAAQLGALVASIDPRRLWPTADVVTTLGGGRPFGFGSVNAEIVQSWIESVADRYLPDASGTAPTLAECLAAFQGQATTDSDAVTDEARGTWDDIQAALTLDRIPDADVWYPAGSGRKGEETFDHVYEFFEQTAGIVTKLSRPQNGRCQRPLVGLARPSQPPAEQFVHSRQQIVDGPDLT